MKKPLSELTEKDKKRLRIFDKKIELCDCYIDDDAYFMKDGKWHCIYCKKQISK